MAKFNILKNLPLLIEVGAEVVALAETVKTAKKDGKVSLSEKYTILKRLGGLLNKLGVDINLLEPPALFNQEEVVTFDQAIASKLSEIVDP